VLAYDACVRATACNTGYIPTPESWEAYACSDGRVGRCWRTMPTGYMELREFWRDDTLRHREAAIVRMNSTAEAGPRTSPGRWRCTSDSLLYSTSYIPTPESWEAHDNEGGLDRHTADSTGQSHGRWHWTDTRQIALDSHMAEG
jgi:hypothetical protein